MLQIQCIILKIRSFLKQSGNHWNNISLQCNISKVMYWLLYWSTFNDYFLIFPRLIYANQHNYLSTYEWDTQFLSHYSTVQCLLLWKVVTDAHQFQSHNNIMNTVKCVNKHPRHRASIWWEFVSNQYTDEIACIKD